METKTNWNVEDCDPIKDILEAKKMIEKETGIYRSISFQEALHYDAQFLYMMGYSSEQVNSYIETCLKTMA